MFSNNQNQLKDKSDVHYFKLPYTDNLSHNIKNKLSRLCKELFKENLFEKKVLIHSKLKIIFYITTQFLMIRNPSQYINLFVLTVVLAILVKLVISLLFLNIYTPLQHALTPIILCFKIIDKANSKFVLKITEA